MEDRTSGVVARARRIGRLRAGFFGAAWGPAGFLLAAWAMAALATSAAAQSGPDTIDLSPCRLEGYDGPAKCGRLAVPEDPARPEGRSISLRIAVLPATGPDSGRDPVFVFDGGPGESAVDDVGWISDDLSAALGSRAVVLVDRRGAGGSNPLRCDRAAPTDDPKELMKPLSMAALERCRDVLAQTADPALYTTPFAVDDVDRVRAALHYDRINLYGVSYGSREALVYLRRHPSHVRSVVISAVTPPNRRAALMSPRSAETSMRRLLDDCAEDAACHGAFPDVRAELDSLVARLGREPARFSARAPDGSTEELRMTRTEAGGTLRMLLVSPGLAVEIPRLIHAAYGGDWTPLGGWLVRIRRVLPSSMGRALFLSVLCSEEVARIDPHEVERETAGTFWGDGWIREMEEQCASWPRGRLPKDYFEPPRGAAPVLMLAGWLDPIAPPAWPAALERSLPNARRIVVREGHHNFPLGDCGKRALATFLDRADPWAVDAACFESIRRPSFAIPGP
jgi:pimeloyl-ACP methyl ester carboxylesterase